MLPWGEGDHFGLTSTSLIISKTLGRVSASDRPIAYGRANLLNVLGFAVAKWPSNFITEQHFFTSERIICCSRRVCSNGTCPMTRLLSNAHFTTLFHYILYYIILYYIITAINFSLTGSGPYTSTENK